LKTIVASQGTLISSSDLYSLGFQLSDMLVSCDFNGQPCSVDDFKWWRDYEYGNCFTFNSLKFATSRSISRSGPGNGLNMELFTGLQGID